MHEHDHEQDRPTPLATTSEDQSLMYSPTPLTPPPPFHLGLFAFSSTTSGPHLHFLSLCACSSPRIRFACLTPSFLRFFTPSFFYSFSVCCSCCGGASEKYDAGSSPCGRSLWLLWGFFFLALVAALWMWRSFRVVLQRGVALIAVGKKKKKFNSDYSF